MHWPQSARAVLDLTRRYDRVLRRFVVAGGRFI